MRDRQMQTSEAASDAHVVDASALRDPSRPEPSLDQTAQDQIGSDLRAMYDSLLSQPIPERFIDLIEKLGSTESDKHGE